MNPSNIPDRLSVKSPPFTGVYVKRKMMAANLYCWFNSEDDVIFPHISIDISMQNNPWELFHITFPIVHKGGWSSEGERKSFSLYYRIRGGSVELYDQTNTRHIRRVDKGGMDYRDMTEESMRLALSFVRNAMVAI